MREGRAQNSDFAQELRFMNPWITPEPAQNPWIQWQQRLLLKHQLQRSEDAQVRLYVYYQHRLNQLDAQLIFTQEELQQRTNELLFGQQQLRYQAQQIAVLQNQYLCLVNDLGAARQERQINRDLAVSLIRRITQIFHDIIPQIQ